MSTGAVQTWTNWAGNQSCAPHRFVRPADIDELRVTVARAASSGSRMRVVGGGHSFTPIVCTTGVLIDLSNILGSVEVDAQRSVTRAPAGMVVRELAAALWEQGYLLKNQGDIDVQTIAGAMCTATHGSGLSKQSFSGALLSAEYVAADGSLRTVSPDDREIDAFRTSLGVLGVLTSVELAVMPAYQLHERVDYWSLEEVIQRWPQEMAERRHFSFFWGPQEQSLGLYGLDDRYRSGLDCYVKRYDELPLDAEPSDEPGRRTGPGHLIYPMIFEDGWHEFEYFVPFDQALEALSVVRGVMHRHSDQPFPMEVRAVAGETSWMSPMTGRDSVSISVSGVAGTDYAPFLRDVDGALTEFGGRAHWGKLHFMDADRLADLYPHYQDFVDLRRSLDPHGLFLNDHLASLVG